MTQTLQPFQIITPAADGRITKSDLKAKALEITAPVHEGYASALDTDIQLKAVQEVVIAARTSIADAVKAEAALYAKNDSRKAGVRFEVRNGAVQHDYEADPVYASLKAQMEARKKLLDAALKSETIADENGAVVPRVSVKKTNDSYIQYTMPE